MSNQAKAVKLAGTNEWGVKQIDQYGRSVVEYFTTKQEPKPDASEGLTEALDAMKDNITAQIVDLTEALGRLRRLQVRALDGDQGAIATAIEVADESAAGYVIDDDAYGQLQCDVEALEELIGERVEERADIRVDKEDEIDAKVAEIALPFISDEKYCVTITTSAPPRHNDHSVNGAIIRVERARPWVDVGVFPQYVYVGAKKAATPLQEAMAALTELKGLEGALAIQAEVLNKVKNVGDQTVLIWKAVVDARKAV